MTKPKQQFVVLFGLGAIAGLMSACAPATLSADVREAPSMGNENAPTKVVIYSDFQCPYCKLAASAFKELLAEHPEKAHLYFKHFPLRQHPEALNAARAAEAARMQGKFWEMHDLLFNNAVSLTDGSFAEFAAMLGLDVERFKADMDSERVAARIAADRSEADYLGLDGTPFLVVNGKPYKGSFVDLIHDIESR